LRWFTFISPPFNNIAGDALVRREGYTLAFLSSTKDDREHIPAVCVAEDAESESLIVQLAVNKVDWEDGNRVLRQLKTDFKNIFEALSQLQHTSISVENDIFAAIVAMCRDRILCRLGFVANSRNAVEQSIKAVLQETMNSLNLLKTKTQVPFSKVFAQRAREAIKLTDLWTKHQTTARLGDLVTSLYHLGQVGNVQSILDAIPNTSMDPKSRKNLFNVIRKVGRYKEAARFLYRTAKRFPLARHIRVVLVTLPPEFFQRLGASQYDSTLLNTLSRFHGGHGERDLNQICI
jgi:hypothetical protein